jgi:hypothetical protein
MPVSSPSAPDTADFSHYADQRNPVRNVLEDYSGVCARREVWSGISETKLLFDIRF